MSLSSQSSASLAALLSFLNARSSEPFTQQDLEWLFHIPLLADVFNRVVDATLKGTECVLGVDELDVYESLSDGCSDETRQAKTESEIRREVESMNAQAEILRRQVNSMKARINVLEDMSGGGPGRGSEMDQLTLKIEEADDQVHNERVSLSHEANEFIASIGKASSHEWIFTDSKHINDVYAADDELLRTLDSISNVMLGPPESDNVSAEIDSLSAELADAQYRLFTVQVSHSYLTSLNQSPTPSRNPSNIHTNTVSELRTLQVELDALITHCEEATRLLARQKVMDKMSDTALRERIGRLERELDGVQRIEDSLEGMIGRMASARNLMILEKLKLDALGQVFCRLGESLKAPAPKEMTNGNSQQEPKPIDTTAEMTLLQNLIGIKDMQDVEKILLKASRLDKELFDASAQKVKDMLDETTNIMSPLKEAVYADSASRDLKFISPDLILRIHDLEECIDHVKRGMNGIAQNEVLSRQAAQFVNKWGAVIG